MHLFEQLYSIVCWWILYMYNINYYFFAGSPSFPGDKLDTMDNTTANINYDNNSLLHPALGFDLSKEQYRLRIGILVSYLFTMTLGLVGNGLVIYIIGRNTQVRNKSVANYYIWNLAFADMMFLLTMPFFCYATYNHNWPFGVVVCKMTAAFKETMRYTSMFTLVALSFDRYLASFYNMAYLRTIKVGIYVCCAIWVMSGVIAVPYAMHAQLRNNQCGVKFSTETMLVFMVYFQLVSALVVPLLLICISYTLLAIRLRYILPSTVRSVQRPNRKMTRTVLVVIITFIIWQTPYHVNNILYNAHSRSAGGTEPTKNDILTGWYLNIISTIFLFISSCCNPIIYGILNDNYSKCIW